MKRLIILLLVSLTDPSARTFGHLPASSGRLPPFAMQALAVGDATRDIAIVCPIKELSLLGLEPLDTRSTDPHTRVVVHSLGYTHPDKLPSCSTEQKWLTLNDDGEQKDCGCSSSATMQLY